MKAWRFLSLLLATMGLWSCGSSEEVINPEEETPAKEYMISIGFKGEISVSEVPLSRVSGDDLYGINVYSCGAMDEEDNYKAYAYGLFDDLETMNIKLIEGYKYKFVATMVTNGKNKIRSHENGEYNAPFQLYTGGYTYFCPISNSFIYANSYLGDIENGYSVLTDESYNRPNLDRFYGEHIGYTPTENGNVSISMKRTIFGLKTITNNLTEGTLSISMEKAPILEIVYPSTEIEDIFTFNKVFDAYATENYTETISTTFTWTRSDGIAIPMGTHDITFKRNKQTIVTVEINDASVENGLSLNLDTEIMGEGNTYTVEGDKITDTTVTPSTGE